MVPMIGTGLICTSGRSTKSVGRSVRKTVPRGLAYWPLLLWLPLLSVQYAAAGGSQLTRVRATGNKAFFTLGCLSWQRHAGKPCQKQDSFQLLRLSLFISCLACLSLPSTPLQLCSLTHLFVARASAQNSAPPLIVAG